MNPQTSQTYINGPQIFVYLLRIEYVILSSPRLVNNIVYKKKKKKVSE